jgi:hypothetical protein
LSKDLCKEARIDTEHKPSCIDLIINEPNMRVRITSGYIRGINLSKLIRIYTKFDFRVIKLLRLFRILAKVCSKICLLKINYLICRHAISISQI